MTLKTEIPARLSAGIAAAALALCAAPGLAGPDDSAPIVSGSLMACPHDGTILGGVNACGKIWHLQEGRAQLNADGRLLIQLNGLVLNDATLPPSINGTPDGVTAVVGSVICGGSGGAVAAQSDLVPITTAGNAQISQKLDIPRPCIAPVIVVREFYNNAIGGWLAAIGR